MEQVEAAGRLTRLDWAPQSRAFQRIAPHELPAVEIMNIEDQSRQTVFAHRDDAVTGGGPSNGAPLRREPGGARSGLNRGFCPVRPVGPASGTTGILLSNLVYNLGGKAESIRSSLMPVTKRGESFSGCARPHSLGATGFSASRVG